MDDEHAGDDLAELQTSLEDQRARFLDAVSSLRPRLHRFCARMCGSVLDGEDIVQDVLIHAVYKLPSLRDKTRLKPWLFRIAHNKCIDLLRRQKPELFSVELEDPPAASGSGPDRVCVSVTPSTCGRT
jgi:RNA polymerase sigma factor (sigma-70 family)